MAGDDEILRIAAQFDVGSITAGMDEAAAAVQSGTAKMSAGMNTVVVSSAVALKQIMATGVTAQQAAVQLQAAGVNANTVAAALQAVAPPAQAAAQAVAQFNTNLAATATVAQGAAASINTTAGSVSNARIAFTGLTQDLGLRGSRVLGSFIAQSQMLGPILQAAFPVVAVLAFLEILDAGYHKLIDFTSALAGWDKEAQRMYSHLVDLNQAQVRFNAELDIERLSMSEIGLKGAALDRQKLINLKVEEQIVQDKLNESSKREFELSEQLAALKHPNFLGVFPDKEKIAEVDAQLQKAVGTTQEWADKLKTLQQFTIPKTGMEQVAKATEEAQKAAEKYADTLAKIADEDSAATQRNAEKELRDLEKVMNERERMEEELEKTTLDLAKKDLESFQHSIIEKARMQEQFGRDEIEQIKAAAEAQSKSTQAHSFAGAADPALIQIADRSLDEQAFKIMDLIALEEKLRATLIQTGAAESDPKIQESLGRQQQLIQQLAIAMQKYDAAVQKASDDQSRKFIQSFDAITGKVNSSILSWVNGTESFGKAMEKVWIGLADTAIESLLKIAEQELIGMLLHKTIADTQKLDDAKTAAAGAYAATSSIPIVGPVLAPAAAAAAFAAVLAFEKGGIMPNQTGLALLHPREMVLPSNISQSVQRMASGGASAGGRGSGPMHVHINVSGQPSSSDLKSIESHIVSTVKRARRRGSF